MTDLPVDIAAARRLQDLLAAGYPQLVSKFLRHTGEYIDQIAAALAAGDQAAVSATAHKMKSSCGQFGLQHLQQLANEIEYGGALSQEARQALHAQLRPAFDQACGVLRQHGLDGAGSAGNKELA